MTELFDCTPKMAAKLARCAEIAERQRQAPDVDLWSAEDRVILQRWPIWDGNYYLYWRNLNA